MAASNRGTRGGNRRQEGRNNNPEGRNQYSGSPLAKAATIGGAVAAGIFLWTRRNQISEQIGSLAEQIGDWRDRMASGDELAADDSDPGRPFIARSSTDTTDQRSQSEIAEEALTLKEIGTVS